MPGYLGCTRIPPFNSRESNKPSLQNEQVAGSCHCLGSGTRNSRPEPSSLESPKIFYSHKPSSFDSNQQLINGGRENHCDPDLESYTDTENSKSKKTKLRFRLLLRSEDSGILRYRLGENYHLLNSYLCLARKKLPLFEAKNIIYRDDLILADFASAKEAISCMFSLKKSLSGIADKIALKMVLKQAAFCRSSFEELRTDIFFFYKINEQKPVIDHRVLAIAEGSGILKVDGVDILQKEDQRKLRSFLEIIRENWQNPFFNVSQLCDRISSSKSRLYRRCKDLAGISPVRVIKEYRLLRCLSSIRSQKSITKVLYDSGFNSPSYFCRCFKKRFGISPRYYQKHLI